MHHLADAFVTVAVFYSLPGAVVARSALEARGLQVQSIGTGLPGVCWTYMVAVGGIELRVPAECEAAARALLSEGERPPLRESAAFWARPIRNIALCLVLFPFGIWPHWVRRQGRVPRRPKAPPI